ncbi:MAG: cell division protein SepF [Actinomycetia bacterium]|nr:cell division protein SepF [Actinomycetes bacterium]
MGIWDNLKGRLSGGPAPRSRGRDDDVEYPDNYGDNDQGNDYPAYDEQGTGEPADYEAWEDQNDSDGYTPLVSMTDIRSQRIPIDEPQGMRRDRIHQPVPYQRQSGYSPSSVPANSQDAFRDDLARSGQNSLIHLHQERLRMEAADLPEFPATVVSGRVSPRSAGVAAPGRGASLKPAPSYRGRRHIEQLRPASYADAEAIAQQLREGAAVILDLTGVRPELAKRLLDFSFGVTSAFQGQVDRYADRVYILTRNGSLTEAEMATLSGA